MIEEGRLFLREDTLGHANIALHAAADTISSKKLVCKATL
jgi:hypothetical protein